MEPVPSRVIPKRRTTPKPKRTWLKVLAAFIGVGVLFDVLLLAMQIGLPTVNDVRAQRWPEASWVVTGDGRVIGELYQEHRRTVGAGDLPALVRNAFVAAHDPSYFRRGPLTISDLISALLRSGARADGHPGGLSVPLAYGILPKPHGTYDRMRAWLLARRLENGLTKDDLLALYLNRVDLGEGIHGVEEAALHFFSHRVTEIGPTQVAVLASIAPRPTARSPRGPENLAVERRNLVLDRMVKLDALSSIEVEKQKALPLGLQIFHADSSVFLQTVRNRLRLKLGRDKIATGGLTVDVAEDDRLQLPLRTALHRAAAHADELSGWRGPVSSVDAKIYDAVRALALDKAPGSVLDLSPALHLLASGDVAAIASVSRVLPVAAGQTAVGRVIEVTPEAMTVDLGGVTARVSAAEAKWATDSLPAPPPAPKKSKHGPPPPPPTNGLDQLLHPGDLVWVSLLGAGDGKVVPGHLTQEGGFDAAGLVVENDTGRILAMVGGVTFNSGHFDRARNLVRSVGAGLSMITYGLYLDKGEVTAGTLIDRATDISPTLWDGDVAEADEDDARARKKITAFQAFQSHDVAGDAAVINTTGAATVLTDVQQLGFRKTTAPWLLKGPLGSPLALANAWTVLGNSGTAEAPHTVDDVLDSEAKRVWASVDNTSAILKQGTVDLMRHWLAETTPRHREMLPSHLGLDSWCAGRVGKIIVAVWVGPNRIIPGLRPVPGDGPAREAFNEVSSGQTLFELGESVVRVSIDLDTGLLSKASDARMMPFLPTTAPQEMAPYHAPHARVSRSGKKKSGHR